MNKTTAELNEIKLIGLDLGHKTTNENGQSSIDGGNLWQQFEKGNYAKRIPNRTGDEIYAVYYGYEGDHTKPFRYFIGCRVTENETTPEGLDRLTIPEGTFRKLTAKGKMPDCIINAWKKIWTSGIQRGYRFDFEVYDERSKDWSDAEIDIYLSDKQQMKKQILFAHSGGAQGSPGKGSYDFVKWLQGALGKRYEILYPIIQDPEAPTYEMWEAMLDNEFAEFEDDGILIGHSLGGSMLLKYLSERESDFKIGALFLVASPYWGKDGWDMENFILKKDFPKLLPPISSIHLFHCKDDPFVPFEHMKLYQKNLSGAVSLELKCSSHAFANGLPELVEIIKNLYGE